MFYFLLDLLSVNRNIINVSSAFYNLIHGHVITLVLMKIEQGREFNNIIKEKFGYSSYRFITHLALGYYREMYRT